MSVLIIKNIPMEGPGTIEDYLKEKRLPYEIKEFSKGERINHAGDFTHLVIMGGPMAVYEMDRYDYLKEEAELIEDFIKNGKAVLGICLGAQMIAHVLGARVYPGGVQEVGWYMVEITQDGMEDPVLKNLSIDNDTPKAEVFHWHGDTFELPDGSVRLAMNETYENQAFRYGSNVYALQFHIEVTPAIVREWFEGSKDYDVDSMVGHTEEIFPLYLARAKRFYEGFFSL